LGALDRAVKPRPGRRRADAAAAFKRPAAPTDRRAAMTLRRSAREGAHGAQGFMYQRAEIARPLDVRETNRFLHLLR
jgi:hypothetical protein